MCASTLKELAQQDPGILLYITTFMRPSFAIKFEHKRNNTTEMKQFVCVLNNWGMPFCKLHIQIPCSFLFKKIKKNLRFHKCYIIFRNSSFMRCIKAKGYAHKNSWNPAVKHSQKIFIEVMDQNKFTANICYLHAPFFCILALEPGLSHLQMLYQQ
jgi:hypothetical protein